MTGRPSRSRSRAERAYEALLRCYPRAYRTRFGPAMRDTFLRDHVRVCAAGTWAIARFWAVTVTQAAWFGLGEHARSRAALGRAAWRTAMAADARYAVRLLARSPLFTATAGVSLALGIAAATAVFALADALLLRPAPGVRQAAHIVEIARTIDGTGFGTLSYPLFEHLREHTRSLDAISITTLDPVPVSLSEGAFSERVHARAVSAGYFELLGVRPAAGRFFRTDEDRRSGSRPAVVLTHRFWRERFQSDAQVLGRSLRLNNTVFTVIGVAEPGFENTSFVGTDLWVPASFAPAVRGESPRLLSDPSATWHMAIGRLRPGATAETAEAEMNALVDASRHQWPTLPPSHAVTVVPSGRVPPPVRQAFATFVGLLFVLAAGLLAVACSNVSAMLLARATTRDGEIATRRVLGASGTRLAGQMLIETLVLFALGGAAAVPLTLWLTHAIRAALPPLAIPIQLDLIVTARVWLFGAGVSLVCGVIFGLAPARRVLRHDFARLLHGRAATAMVERLRLRRALVVVQVATALAIVATAVLLGRTLHAAAQIDPGFQRRHVDVVTLDTTLAGARGPDALALVDRVVEQIRGIGAVAAVGYARMVPLQGGSFTLGGVRVSGADGGRARVDVDGWDVVSPEYFRAIALPILEGRTFTAADGAGRPLVAIVNESFARAAWPGRSAVGQRFWQTRGRDDDGRAIEVVGVAKDAKYRSLGEAPRRFVYVPFAQHPQTHVELFVTRAAGASLARELREAVRQADAALPVVLIQSFEDAAALAMLPHRLAAWVAGGAGAVALSLAALGLYGLAAFLVSERRREIAIRVALGATRRAVRGMVLMQAVRVGAAGAALGVSLAAGLAWLVQQLELLVGVRPLDPLSLAGAGLAMAAVLMAASYVPAERAASADPARALRGE